MLILYKVPVQQRYLRGRDAQTKLQTEYTQVATGSRSRLVLHARFNDIDGASENCGNTTSAGTSHGMFCGAVLPKVQS